MNDSKFMNDTKPDRYKVFTFVSADVYKSMFRVCDAAKIPVNQFIRACIENGIKSLANQYKTDFRRVKDDNGDLPF